MQLLLNDLTAALDSQIQHLGTMLEIARNISQAAQQSDVTNIQALTGKLQIELQQMGRVEFRRDQAGAALASKLGLSHPTLSQLVQALMPHQPTHAQQLGRQLAQSQGLIQSLQHVDAQNKQLLQNQLDIVQFQLNLMTDTGMGSAVYGGQGGEQADYGGTRINLLDTKA